MRKTKIVTITDGGEEKKFKIVAMSAMQAQDFGLKFCLALAESKGASAPIDVNSAGIGSAIQGLLEGFAKNGFGSLAGIPFHTLKELKDELLRCCKRVINGVDNDITPELIDMFISDMSTLTKLQVEAYKLSFFQQKVEEDDSSTSPQSSSQKVTVTRRRG